MRFLIVDDSSTMRRIFVNTLRKLGYRCVREAGNGREGLARFIAEPADIVITDWIMPEMDGLDFVRRLRASAQGAHVPVLMVTTNAGTAEVSRALAAGVTSFVVKPFTADILREKIDAVVTAPSAPVSPVNSPPAPQGV